MTVRRRLSLAAAAAVAIAIAIASLASYLAVQAKLLGEVDSALKQRAQEIQAFSRFKPPLGRPPRPPLGPTPQAQFGGAAGLVQFVAPDGRPRQIAERKSRRIPLTPQARAVARGSSSETLLQDQTVSGQQLRVLTAPLDRGGAVQVARPLNEVESVLHQLVLLFAVITAGGIGLAALLGAVVSRASLAPVVRFTEETESISQGPDLSLRLPVVHDDELGRLARSYNATLEALERSADAQRQMVSDASHELRTPLASLKTNLELLLRSDDRLPDVDRIELESDLVEQIDELTLLVDDVVELARRGEAEKAAEDVDLDEVVGAAIERVQRHASGIRFEVRLEPCTVKGRSERIGRAVYNLLDNAAKWSPSGATVEVRLTAGTLSIRDHGPGIGAENLPFVFDRFYRAPEARSRPGSGLGLAIVRQTAEAHGAEVSAANAEGGGAVLTLRFPDAVLT